MIPDTKIGYNMGLVYTQMQSEVFEFTENEIMGTLKKLQSVNEDLKALQRLNASLATAKKNKEKINYQSDVEMQMAVDRVRALDPIVFRELTYLIEPEQIDGLLTSCKEMTNERMTEVNRINSYVTLGYQNRILLTECAQKALDLLYNEIRGIISNQKSFGG